MGDYNGEQLAIESAEALWTALQKMNLTTLDPSYRPSVNLAWQSTGTPYTAVLDALRAVLTVIVSVDPWLTHVTSHAQVADSIIDALCDSGESVAYHIRRLRRVCLDAPAVDLISASEPSDDYAGSAFVAIGRTLERQGTGPITVWAESVIRDGVRVYRAFPDPLPTDADCVTVQADSWLNLAVAIARHYNVTGEITLTRKGETTPRTFSFNGNAVSAVCDAV